MMDTGQTHYPLCLHDSQHFHVSSSIEVPQLDDSAAVGRAHWLAPYPALVWLTDHLHILLRRGSNSTTVPQDLHYFHLKPLFKAEMGNSMETRICNQKSARS